MPRVASRKGRLRTADVETDETVHFRDLMLSEPVMRGLLDSGFERPSPIQLQGIPVGLVGTDLIAQAKSGTGKTCVFAVVVLESLCPERSVPQAVVLAPTREIAVQIGQVLSAIGSHCTGLALEVLIGGMAIQKDRERLRCCNVVVGTPGRLCALLGEGSLPGEAVRMLVLDEADKLMDDIFLPDLEYVVGALPQRKQILALSATYTDGQRELLTRWMRDPTTVLLDADSVSLRGVAQQYQVVAPLGHATGQYALFEGKATALLQLLGVVAFHQCLVFLNTRARAYDLVATLNHHGYPAAFISGDLPQQQRNAAMANMRSLRLRVLVSTDLTSRGVDVERVNLVINLDLPRCAETYIHRVGRTGRFGTRGLAIALVGSDELPVLSGMVKSLNSSIEPIGSQVKQVTCASVDIDVNVDSASASDNVIDDEPQQRGTDAAESSDRGIRVSTEASGRGANDTRGMSAQTGTVEDEAAAAQLARLKQLRKQAAAKESDALELRRHQKAAGGSRVEDRAGRQWSKSRDFKACGLRVSFSDGSTITEGDATELPKLFRKFGEIRSTQFRVGKMHGWVDFVDTSIAMAARIRDAVNGIVAADAQLEAASGSSSSGNDSVSRQLVVQPWANGSAASITEGSARQDHSNPDGSSEQQSRPANSTMQPRDALATDGKNDGANGLPSPGSIVWAKYTVDSLWYRAKVTELIRVGGGGQSESSNDEDFEDGDGPGATVAHDSLRVAVTYLGYGNFEVLPLSSVWPCVPEPEPEPDYPSATWMRDLSSQKHPSTHAEATSYKSTPQPSNQRNAKGSVGEANVCYGHPWYVDHLMSAFLHVARPVSRTAAMPIAPFPFPRSAFEIGSPQDHRQWQWRWRWPSPPPSHQRKDGE